MNPLPNDESDVVKRMFAGIEAEVEERIRKAGHPPAGPFTPLKPYVSLSPPSNNPEWLAHEAKYGPDNPGIISLHPNTPMLPNDEQPTPFTDSRAFPVVSDLQSGTRLVVDADYCRALELRLAAAEKRLLEAEEDTRRLDFLIKAGPPGAAENIGLNAETWELACGESGGSGEDTDNRVVRVAIDKAMQPSAPPQDNPQRA